MRIDVLDMRTIDLPGLDYVGWPTLVHTRAGELVTVFSGGRQQHVCPFGKLMLIRSADLGQTWTGPQVLADGPLDDRDGGLVETAQGTLIANWFTSRQWEISMDHPDTRLADARRQQWQQRRDTLTPAIRQAELGLWSIRSTDGGYTWSPRIDSVVGSPHGAFNLSDGTLMQVGKIGQSRTTVGRADEATAYLPQIGAATSIDDGQSWKLFSHLPVMPGHEVAQYHELHGVQAADGRIVVHIRNHNPDRQYETLQTHSLDGGRSWSPVTSTGIWGYPAFLVRTADGRLITTVGHRREPHGIQIAISEDHGQSWLPAMALNTDSAGDLGYPSTVEVAPNDFVSLWYDDPARQARTVLRWARWRLV